MHAFMRERMSESVCISIGLQAFGLEMRLIEIAEAVGRTKKDSCSYRIDHVNSLDLYMAHIRPL